jgi:hypothetical protein
VRNSPSSTTVSDSSPHVEPAAFKAVHFFDLLWRRLE